MKYLVYVLMIFGALSKFNTVIARVLKFHILIPHKKIAHSYFIFCTMYFPFWSYGPLKDNYKLVSKIFKKVVAMGTM